MQAMPATQFTDHADTKIV